MNDPATLKNVVEKLIVIYLQTAYRPLRLAEIVKALGINRKNCSKSLHCLIETGFIILRMCGTVRFAVRLQGIPKRIE
jgi:DNA-binding IclR family transcriptional regulator